MLDIRVDDLVPIAEATFKGFLSDLRDAKWQGLLAKWQNLSVNPRTCPRDAMPRLCTYNAWFARPATTHRKTIFRLALSHKCVQALLRFRLGCHNLFFFPLFREKPYMSAKFANRSNISGQLEETSGMKAHAARPTIGEAALPWQAIFV